jgi:voltage-gated potassium channel
VPADEDLPGGLQHVGYELFMAALSILAIVNVVLAYASSDESTAYVLGVVNVMLSVTFLGDFAYRLATAPSRRRYLLRGFGWADLVAALPFSGVKLLRAFSLLRLRRALRAHGRGGIVASLVRDRAGSALLSLIAVAILVLEFGSLQMLRIEASAQGSTITDASDALWFSLVTMSTVGYGDTYPVTNAGRALGSVIIIVGVCIFGTLTGYLANAFLRRARQTRRHGEDTVDVRIQNSLEEMHQTLRAQQRALVELDDLVRRTR